MSRAVTWTEQNSFAVSWTEQNSFAVSWVEQEVPVTYFYDDFIRSDGAIGNGWIGSTWTILSNKAICTPTGIEKLTNGNFSAWGSLHIPTGWATAGVDGETNVDQVASNEGHGGAGLGAANLYRAVGTGAIKLRYTLDLNTNKFYQAIYSLTKYISGGIYLILGGTTLNTAVSEKTVIVSMPGNGTAKLFDITSGAAISDTTIDNASCVELNLASQLLLRQFNSIDWGMRINQKVDFENPGGLALFDNPSNPLNGLLLYVIKGISQDSPVNLVLDKYLAGIRSNLATVQVSANFLSDDEKEIALIKQGTNYTIRYNHADINTYSVTDAEITACHYMGLFSCVPASTFGTFCAYEIPVINSEYILQNDWIVATPDNYSLISHSGITNPVIDKNFVTGWTEAVGYVADPFIVRNLGKYYLFFEVSNQNSSHTEVGYASSDDGLIWLYGGIILARTQTSFNGMSFPYIFRAGNNWWMIPDMQLSRVELWCARLFPSSWEYARTLLSPGFAMRDSILFKWNSNWYLISRNNTAASLVLYVSSTMTGTYTAHPSSPIYIGNERNTRPGGRPIIRSSSIDIMLQDNIAHYGDKLRCFRISTLSPTEFVWAEIATQPLLQGSGIPGAWNEDGMHHCDRTNSNLALVDGLDGIVYSIGIYKDS